MGKCVDHYSITYYYLINCAGLGGTGERESRRQGGVAGLITLKREGSRDVLGEKRKT